MSAVFGPSYSPSALREQLTRSLCANDGGAVIIVVSETFARGQMQTQMAAMSLDLKLRTSDMRISADDLARSGEAVLLDQAHSASEIKERFISFVADTKLAAPRIMVIAGTVHTELPAKVLASDPVIIDAEADQLPSMGLDADYLQDPQSLMERMSVALGGFGSMHSIRDLMARKASEGLPKAG